MITRLARHSLELVVLLFAVLGFVYVPLGERTGWQHLLRVWQTEEAREATGELGEAARDLVDELAPDARELLPARVEPVPVPSGGVAVRPGPPEDLLSRASELDYGPPAPPWPVSAD